jgi:hypothetical protein
MQNFSPLVHDPCLLLPVKIPPARHLVLLQQVYDFANLILSSQLTSPPLGSLNSINPNTLIHHSSFVPIDHWLCHELQDEIPRDSIQTFLLRILCKLVVVQRDGQVNRVGRIALQNGEDRLVSSLESASE